MPYYPPQRWWELHLTLIILLSLAGVPGYHVPIIPAGRGATMANAGHEVTNTGVDAPDISSARLPPIALSLPIYLLLQFIISCSILYDMTLWYLICRIWSSPSWKPAATASCHSSVKPAEFRGNIRFDAEIQQLLRFRHVNISCKTILTQRTAAAARRHRMRM